ncbi:hypothetical protein KFK09_000885 [Dendrobium nobile]|uniref:UBA domain-containing protein n=1 Tax=Dendrobium nobile TaxID=94219 RepID=A0A8T3CD43_DENNO|nr:hypothetical protein KFK09_000885 [Dendrobium nobile]
MSPASKSKSKDKSSPKKGKEQSKISMKPSNAHSNGRNGSPASSYYPVRNCHTLEISPSSFSAPHSNGRFRSVDDPDDHSGSSQGTTTEYDSMSNNGSCSGESEDQKDKPISSPPQPETIPGSDDGKRCKIRQKNERKHQRQKEKRAQELHERCISFLTSRKLEALSHQLVSMGFPADRATMAIIANEGRMEESVAWLLLEEEEDNKQQVSVNLADKSCIKIDIKDELARIAEMEVQQKCSRQDVERAIVACEGDLLKAEENLKLQKVSVSAALMPKPNEFAGSLELNDKEATTQKSPILIRNPTKGITQQHRLDERDFKNSKKLVPGTSPQESVNKNTQPSLKRILPKPATTTTTTAATDWSKTQATSVDKRWSTTNTPVSLASLVQVSGPAAKLEARFAATRVLKEPFVVMQRPKQKSPPPPSTIGMSVSPPASVNGGMGRNGFTMQQFYPQNHLQPTPSVPTELPASAPPGRLWNASGTISSPLATPSSLGLYTGWGSPGSSKSSSQNDWNTFGSTPHPDYTTIDWSLDPAPRKSSTKIDIVSDTWSTMFMGGNATGPPLMNNGGGAYLPELQEVNSRLSGLSDYSAPAGSLEWSSPFEGRDLFRVTRQYVTSPSM